MLRPVPKLPGVQGDPRMSTHVCHIVWFISIMRQLHCNPFTKPALHRHTPWLALLVHMNEQLSNFRLWLSNEQTLSNKKGCEVLLCNLATLTFGLFKAVAQELDSCKSRVDHAWGNLLNAGNVLQRLHVPA
jgi:hypothetical protein